ncbi:hypothetical protein LHJ74_07350 [Streptomyces sp. N2-109]|uniref:DUF6895 domain-containing protein n=1 Tax=Streptomyces gossypii TaxID=2883101 RepID=A0ABT2JPQ7_9ACTN|nr:hypothetical protein [Streptomyces gossypii]MCT2589736.1 hypothetical protein [Streptomyces gossypii]
MSAAHSTAAQDTAAELDRVSLSALSWLHGHLPDFRLPEDVTAPEVSRSLTLKPLAELAEISSNTLRVSPAGSVQHQLAGELLDFAWCETGQGELLQTLARGEPYATYPLEVYGAFAEAGLRHPQFEEFARFIATTRAWGLAEHEPTRKLALLNVQRRLGVCPGPDWPEDGPGAGIEARIADAYRAEAKFDEAMRRTWLGGLAEPWTFEVHAGYALTHYVFHVTNWGAEPERLPVEVCDHLTLWLPAWLDSCAESELWDLTGELLAVAASLPGSGPWQVPVAEVWGAYARAQNAAGAIAESGPPPAVDVRPVPGSRESFLSCYHSTLVGAFAAVLTAARIRAAAVPPDAAPGLSRAPAPESGTRAAPVPSTSGGGRS